MNKTNAGCQEAKNARARSKGAVGTAGNQSKSVTAKGKARKRAAATQAETITQGSRNYGKWTTEEHEAFLRAVDLFGNSWPHVSERIPTRSPAQIRSHAQKHYKTKLRRKTRELLTTSKRLAPVFVCVKEARNTSTIPKARLDALLAAEKHTEARHAMTESLAASSLPRPLWPLAPPANVLPQAGPYFLVPPPPVGMVPVAPLMPYYYIPTPMFPLPYTSFPRPVCRFGAHAPDFRPSSESKAAAILA
jgi:SHAQKYF class myb-like DNA-binding protein